MTPELTTLYGARTIKRRRTRADVAQLEAQILAVLAEDHPQSVRHCFYRMTDPRLPHPVPKTELGYRTVQHRLKEMRRGGRIPYGWIADASRRGYHTSTYLNAADFLTAHASAYRADLWKDSADYVEVWCESRSIASVIQPLCQMYAVSLYPCGGFSSISFVYEAAEFMRENINKYISIIYIGDYDPAGVLIDQSLERELRLHLGDDHEMEFYRLAITEDQIQTHNLPTKPRKPGDKRSAHVTETVEAEAMPAATLREMLEKAIQWFLPSRALEVAQIAEEEERAFLHLLAERIAGA